MRWATSWWAVVVVASLAAGPAKAATYTVNVLTDTGNGSGTTGDLRYCLTQANAVALRGGERNTGHPHSLLRQSLFTHRSC
ncbi:MAG: hypothetical protein IT204_04100 [Fimbriimonadaceae bacterium]|nr:hypothetical protein [Fimbriimonadaceae bacterium]